MCYRGRWWNGYNVNPRSRLKYPQYVSCRQQITSSPGLLNLKAVSVNHGDVTRKPKNTRYYYSSSWLEYGYKPSTGTKIFHAYHG